MRVVKRQCVHPSDQALAALAETPPDRPIVLLHSGRFDRRWAQRSLLAQPRAWYRFELTGRGPRSTLIHAADGSPHADSRHLTHRLWPDLRRLLHAPALPGRWVGYFSYDLARLIEPGKLPPDRRAMHPWPLVELAWCPDLDEFPASPDPPSDDAGAGAGAVGKRNEVELARADARADPHGQTPQTPFAHATPLRLDPPASNFTPDGYRAAVRRVLDYIAAGDVFQVNLAQRFTASYHGDRRSLYHRLAAISPAWYGGYLELPGRRALLSISPELFLEVSGRHVITRPIKGTRPNSGQARNANAETPKQIRNPQSAIQNPIDTLRASEKDAAELNMIVDLMRNDLGRVCAYGSVRVTDPRTIESHPTVHHGVATIEGDLHHSKDIVDLLRATLPGGSVTGAPKVRAMQIIAELEPDPRGPYCGCIGWLSKDAACLNIAIRTMVMDASGGTTKRRSDEGKGRYDVSFSVGAGIVADSDPDAEYRETLDKAAALMQALGVEGTL